MRHLITGGSGFIGSRLAARLIERGEKVRVLDLQADPTLPAAVDFRRASVLDRDAVAAAMRDVDVVHHAAALVAQTDVGLRHFWEVNVDGTRVVAEEAARAGLKAAIHVSSTSVYGLPPAEAITESTPLNPAEDYGRSKLASEQAMRDICGRAAIPLVTIRPRSTLGPGRLGVFQLLFDWIRRGATVYVVGSGEQRMQFIHVDDLIDFNLLTLAQGRSGTFNVGTDRYGALAGELAELIAFAGSASRIRRVPPVLAINALRLGRRLGVSPLAPWHFLTAHRSCHFDVAPLLATGWRPRHSNMDMLRESYGWFCREAGRSDPAGRSPHRAPMREGILGLVRRIA